MATAIERVVASAGIGHNSGAEPEPAKLTPYEASKIHIDDLFEEAKNFLDGEPITTQEMADAVDRIKALALEAEKAGEELRKAEAKPFDDGKKAVQERWNPLVHDKTGKCRQIIATCNKATTPFLIAEQAKIDAAAAELRRIADAAAEEARAKLAIAAPDNLTSRADAEEALATATTAERVAAKREGARAQARGGARATSLRSVWVATIADRRAALNYYIARNPEDFVAVIQQLADSEARSGPRTAPGITFTETKVAV